MTKELLQKAILDNMYSALRYQSKKGNTTPLDTYLNLSTNQSKADFVKQYQFDKSILLDPGVGWDWADSVT